MFIPLNLKKDNPLRWKNSETGAFDMEMDCLIILPGKYGHDYNGEDLDLNTVVYLTNNCKPNFLTYQELINISDLKPPSTEELTDMLHDDISLSVGGEDVEPDGIDADGWPSWLLALGLI